MAKKKDTKATNYIASTEELAVEQATTVTVSSFPMQKCWKCGNETPVSFICKFCGDKNPHRDIKKKKDK